MSDDFDKLKAASSPPPSKPERRHVDVAEYAALKVLVMALIAGLAGQEKKKLGKLSTRSQRNATRRWRDQASALTKKRGKTYAPKPGTI